jgi:proteasome lid subunit RPN8/RPN11
MARDIEVDQKLPPIPMPAEILHELCQHALETSPEECCGLIVGNSLERYLRVVRCRNDMTAKHKEDPKAYPRSGHAAYHMNESDYLEARKEADTAGEIVAAVYHSHVGQGAPYLSDLDVAYAQHLLYPFPEADQIVVPVFERKAGTVAVFRRVDSRFVGHPVEQVHR